MEAMPLIVLDKIAYSNLKKYVWYSDLPEQQRGSEELFRYLLQNKIYVEGFATNCKSLLDGERFYKPIVDIGGLKKAESVVLSASENIEDIDDIIRTVYRVNPALKADRAVIWGTGNNGKFAYEILKKIGVEINYFIDANKAAGDSGKLNGIPIYGLEALDRLDESVVLIEAYDKYYEMDKIVSEKYAHIIPSQCFFCDVHSRYILYRKRGEEKALFGIAEFDRLNLAKLYGKNVKIYGIGEDAIELSCYLRLLDFNFTAYLSDGADCNDTNVDGYPIEPVEEVLYEDNCAIWILCAETERAKKRLKELGVCLDLDVVMPINRRLILDANMGYTYDAGGYYAGMVIYGQERKRNYKIVTLGGSTTDGGYAMLIKPWPLLLYEQLNCKEVTIYNAGVSGYVSGQELIRLVRDVLPLKPDMVLVYDGVNDSGGNVVFPEEPYAFSYARTVYEFAARHIEDESLRKENGTFLVNYGVKSKEGRFGNWLSNMESMQAVCAAKKITFYGFMQPTLLSKGNCNEAEERLVEELEGDYSYMAGFRKMMKTFAIEESHPYIYDLSHIFDEVYDVYFDSCHVYEKGNQIIASEIYKRISDKIDAWRN